MSVMSVNYPRHLPKPRAGSCSRRGESHGSRHGASLRKALCAPWQLTCSVRQQKQLSSLRVVRTRRRCRWREPYASKVCDDAARLTSRGHPSVSEATMSSPHLTHHAFFANPSTFPISAPHQHVATSTWAISAPPRLL